MHPRHLCLNGDRTAYLGVMQIEVAGPPNTADRASAARSPRSSSILLTLCEQIHPERFELGHRRSAGQSSRSRRPRVPFCP